MNITILPIGFISLISIVIIILSLSISYFKKWMMTYSLIIANFIIFILTLIFQREIIFGLEYYGVAGLAFRPIYLSIEYSPQLYTLFTSMFIHSGFAHIIGNMLVFFFIGMSFEQRIGWKKFIIIYLLSGICGTITHSLLNINSSIPLVGASGAIFGIMGAFAYSYPRDKVIMPIPVGFFMILRRIRVIYAVLIFAAIETIIVFFNIQDTTAHFAHLGGLIGGVILAAILIGKNKTHTNNGKTIFYDNLNDTRIREIDYSKLNNLANTTKQKEMLTKIEKENVPQVRDIWLNYFIEKAECPKCKSKLKQINNQIICEKCGYKTNF
jgi:membrane associated rhomboid family serine protease